MARKARKVIGVSPSCQWGQYRKRPVIVSATRVDTSFEVETLEGTMRGEPGDWLIEGIEGELYPCRDSIFRATYEEIEQ